MKKLESKPPVPGSSSYTSQTSAASTASSVNMSPFEQMKTTLRNNLKGLKKEDEKDGGSEAPMTIGGGSSFA